MCITPPKFYCITNPKNSCLIYACKTVVQTQFYKTKFLGAFISSLQANNCSPHNSCVLLTWVHPAFIWNQKFPETKFFERPKMDSSAWSTHNTERADSIKTILLKLLFPSLNEIKQEPWIYCLFWGSDPYLPQEYPSISHKGRTTPPLALKSGCWVTKVLMFIVPLCWLFMQLTNGC